MSNKSMKLNDILKNNNLDIPVNHLSIENGISKTTKANTEEYLSLNDLYSAPEDWNFYGDISPTKMAELIESILSVGMLHPIIVWDKPDRISGKKYMILSGHNRVKAFNLLKSTDTNGDFSKIKAIIKNTTEIDENIAKEIIIDTNWVQRELTTIQKAKSIAKKYTQIKNHSDTNNLKFNVNQIIANEYNISKRQIIQYKILVNLIKPIQDIIDNGKLSIKAGVKIAKLDTDTQEYIYDNLLKNSKYELINKHYSDIKEDMSKEDIIKLFENNMTAKMGKIMIQYPSKEDNNIYKKAYITYPIEDEGYFEDVINIFCGEDHSNNQVLFDENNTYSNGSFNFMKIKR